MRKKCNPRFQVPLTQNFYCLDLKRFAIEIRFSLRDIDVKTWSFLPNQQNASDNIDLRKNTPGQNKSHAWYSYRFLGRALFLRYIFVYFGHRRGFCTCLADGVSFKPNIRVKKSETKVKW